MNSPEKRRPSGHTGTAVQQAHQVDFKATPLDLFTAPRHTAKKWSATQKTWSEFVDRLRQPDDHKECGGYVLGTFKGTSRNAKDVLTRCAVTLDADKACAGFMAQARKMFGALGMAAVVHTTWSHTPESPRYRIIVPSGQPMTPEQYRRIAGWLMECLGQPQFDHTCVEPERLMFWPSTQDPAAYELYELDGHPFNVTELLRLIDEDDDPTDDSESAPGLAPAEPGASPAYEELGPANQERVQRYIDQLIEDWRARLSAAAEWGEDERDEQRRGWEALSRDWAWLCAQLAVAEWSPLTETTARELHDELLPECIAADPKCAGKLTEATFDKAAREVRPLPDLDRFATAEEDFSEPLPDDEGDESATSSWAPVSLAGVISGIQDGTVTRLEPTVGRLDDGRCLFYAGRVNGVAGESGAGKSWTAMLACAQEVKDGHNVVYVDLEDDVNGVLQRMLRDLHCEPAQLTEHFHYVHPETAFKGADAKVMHQLLSTAQPTLVVIDSTGESMAVEGAKPNDDDDVARWFRTVPRTMADSGAAVLLLDHVPKAHDGQLSPIGSQRKRAAINGAQYMQATARSFDQQTFGSATLTTAKDRNGTYRQGVVAARLEMGGGVEPRLLAPGREEVASDRRQGMKAQAIAALRDLPAEHRGLSATALKHEMKGTQADKDPALQELIDGGYIVARYEGQTKLHTLGEKLYAPELDEIED